MFAPRLLAVFTLLVGAMLLGIKTLSGSVAGLTSYDWIQFGCFSVVALLIRVLSGRMAAKLVVMDVRPNEIRVVGGEIFSFGYSAFGRFVTDAEMLDKVFFEVSSRMSAGGGRFIALKEKAHVRIWPGAAGITPLELKAVERAVHLHFMEPELEVMEDGFRSSYPVSQAEPSS